ncbi:hypothetical protein BOTBODRAFT_523502 [Botryobasidium botryosum FD-172 SS1]|uniref:Uncharacterized protein n=1 Tax=Botryobasidium botryosum (strain FD-172 SS1) TaxID=930990 RepID=A0A067MCQ1_BOTB1|nr:hypothetical protein BOTBODRAFT_523502 [Botryobasidium botryosum FD-172 SS1]
MRDPLHPLNPRSKKAQRDAVASLVEFLEGYPFIRKVEVSSCHSEVMRALLRAFSNHLCPQLEELCISQCSIDGLELVGLVKSRSKADGAEGCASPSDTRSLRRVGLACCPSISHYIVSILREYLAVEVEDEKAEVNLRG